jgi:methyl-accepting chemotaxis protein
MKFERPSDFQARLGLYGVDENVRRRLRMLAPHISPAVTRGVGDAVRAMAKMTSVSEIMAKNDRTLNDLEVQHINILMAGAFDDAYVRSCQALIEQAVLLGLTPRTHVAIAGSVMRAAFVDIAPRFRFSGQQFADMASALTATLTFDVATCFAIYQDAAFREAASRQSSVDSAMEDFEPVISEVIDAVLKASRSLDEGSSSLKDSAVRTVDVIKSASAVTVESTQGMASSAQATEELHLSINEIARAVGMGSESAKQAVKNAEDAKCTLDNLVKIANQVGSVVTVISSIAQQTNLLALNATIEAAHAGAAGRGFAVVASEVKALSARTAEATREIAHQIQAMQESTLVSAERMSNVIEAVTQAAATTNSIAVAIDQQRAVTKSIAETVARVANAANKSNADLAAVSESASRGIATSEEIVGWSAKLAAHARTLQSNIGDLYRRVRTA